MTYQKRSNSNNVKFYFLPIMLLLMICIGTISSATAQIEVEVDDMGRSVVDQSSSDSFDSAPTNLVQSHQILPTRVVKIIRRLVGKMTKTSSLMKRINQKKDRRESIFASNPSLTSS